MGSILLTLMTCDTLETFHALGHRSYLPLAILMAYSYLEIPTTLRVVFFQVRPYYVYFILDLVSPLGLGVRLESKVGGYPSDEITCWRLTLVV